MFCGVFSSIILLTMLKHATVLMRTDGSHQMVPPDDEVCMTSRAICCHFVQSLIYLLSSVVLGNKAMTLVHLINYNETVDN